MFPDKEKFNKPNRRVFIYLVGIVGLLLSLPRMAWSFVVKNFPVRSVEKPDFSFNPANGMLKTTGTLEQAYTLLIDGLVEERIELTYEQLRGLPQVEQVSDFHCVEGWSVNDVKWGGFRFAELLKKVKVKPEAKYAVFHSLGRTSSMPQGQDHYLESFPIEKLLRPEAEIIMVLDMDGHPLPDPHGAPLRVISPYDLAYKSIKFVTRVELTNRPQEGWWTLANPIYPMDAPVPPTRLRK